MTGLIKRGWVLLLLMCVAGIGLFGKSRQWWTSLTESSYRAWHLAQLEDLRPCACNRCITALDNEWFTERFNTSVNPFLALDNRLTEEGFLWWKKLQLGNKDIDDYRAVEMKMLETFPKQENFMDSSPERCRTCAVVGNSVNIRNTHFGPLIDFHDFVIRFNRAPTKGYEKDVGSKSTLRVMYPASSVDLDNSTHVMFIPFKTSDLQWLMTAFTTEYTETKPKITIRANKDLVKILNPSFIKYVHQSWLGRKGKYPSTGFLGLMIAMYICDEVNVFGFGADRKGNWRHYWEKPRSRIGTGVHGGSQEYKLIKHLAALQKINFYQGW